MSDDLRQLEEAATPVTEADLMRLLSSDNPKARHHREVRDDGWSDWTCVPVSAAVQVRSDAIALLDERDALRTAIRFVAIPTLQVFAADNAGVRAALAKLDEVTP